MATRVVTIDLPSIFGRPVYAVTAQPYRDDVPVAAPLTGGRYLDVLVQLPAGMTSGDALGTWFFETPPQAVARLRREDGGHLHEFWGWRRRTAALDPEDEFDAAELASDRIATVTLDLGAKLNARLNRAMTLPLVANNQFTVIAAAELDNVAENASRPEEHVYDALEDHPAALRAAVEVSRQVRRERASDAPPAWGTLKEV